jgi:cell division protein FtsI (penicillin-binding protein 3)
MRLKILVFFYGLAFLCVAARLFYWQVVRGEELSLQASYQYNETKKFTAPRGSIMAADGSLYAAQRQSWLLFADMPKIKDDPKKIAEAVAPLILEGKDDSEDYQNMLLNKIDSIKAALNRAEVVWSPIEHKISTETKEKIERLEFEGLGFEARDARYYPESSSSAQLMGFVGKNDKGEDIGYFGLEGFYNVSLSGKTGYLSRERDVSGAPLVGQGSSEINSIAGADLVTHINKRIQISLENNLKLGIEKYGAKSASGIVMDPKTGAIMAMSAYPSFDPTYYFDYSNDLFKNPIISDTFEPGSVFKVLVMAAALDAGAVEPDTKCDICDKPLKVDKYFIETWNNKYHPDATMTEVIVNSDNVGMSFAASRMGEEKLYDYLDKFGLGHLTGIDLQGEVTSSMRKRGSWNIVDLATTSFGQGIATTSIQLINAVAAIANDGVMMTPQVVDKVRSSGWEQDIKPKESSRVIGKEASDQITAMMEEAAKSGEAKWTNLPGFGVAGKTGTAQIPISGHYDADKTIASFVGFAPSNDPKFVMLITLTEPQTSPWASETAAPLWYSVARDLFNYFGIQPQN